MVTLLLTLNAIICVALIILILLQRSDPASGGMFGGAGGAAGPVIRNPLARPTAILATLFLVLSLVLAYLNKGGEGEHSLMSANVETPAPALAPVSPTLPEPTLLAPAEASATETTPTTPAP